MKSPVNLRPVSLQKFIQVEENLKKYFENFGLYKKYNLDAYLNFTCEVGRIKSVGMDFRFNQLRQVKKVNWKENAPWFCEVQDGLSWFGYCLKSDCKAFK